MISFPTSKDLQEFDSRRKKLIAMLSINMSVLHETVLTSDRKLHPRLTYLRDFSGTYFDPVLGARITDGEIEVQINATHPEWRVVLEHELIEDSFGVVIYTPCDDYLALSPECVEQYENQMLENLVSPIGLLS